MAVTIFDIKFMGNLEWFNLKTTSDIAIASFYLIDDKIGAWYELRMGIGFYLAIR